jgi:hypothetical protein
MTLLSAKHPTEVLDFAIDWTEELGGDVDPHGRFHGHRRDQGQRRAGRA